MQKFFCLSTWNTTFMIKSAIYLIIFYVFAAVCDFSIAKQFVSQHQLNINPESVIEGDVMLSNSVFFCGNSAIKCFNLFNVWPKHIKLFYALKTLKLF